MNNILLKQFSFALSVLLYFVLLFGLGKYLSDNYTKVIKAGKHVTVIELELSDIKTKPTTKQVAKPKSNKAIKIKELKTEKNSASKTNKQTSSVKSLFSKVKTDAIKTTKQTITNKKKSEVASRLKSKKEKNEKVNNKQKISNSINESKQRQVSLNVQNSGSTDEYYSQIYSILYDRWRPYEIDKDHTAQIVVYISKNGEFSYRFKRYSENVDFDNQLIRFLDSQLTQPFPISDEGNDVTILVAFTTKD